MPYPDIALLVNGAGRELAQIAEVLMEPLAIIEPFNKRKDLPARFVPDMWKKKGQTE